MANMQFDLLLAVCISFYFDNALGEAELGYWYLHVQLTANQTARLPFCGVKWPFSRGRGPIVRVLTSLWSI